MQASVPVITLDGPAGVGKSTLARAVADETGFVMLASGSLYRLVAWQALHHNWLDSTGKIVAFANSLKGRDWLVRAQELGDALAGSEISAAASRIAACADLRAALLDLQRGYAAVSGDKGLVAEGRDMGTVVFPEADCKFFITASPKVRALRRCLQRDEQPGERRVAEIAAEIAERDARDAGRKTAPLKPARDALVVNTSDLDVKATLKKLFAHIRHCIDV